MMTSASTGGAIPFQMPPRPYPGLRPFDKSEWPIFFGREHMTAQIIEHLIGQRLVVVHGDSGCGKSSIIRAGVLPRLEQESARGGVPWRTAVTQPMDAPLWRLAQGLAGEQDGPRVLALRRVLNYGVDAPQAVLELLRADRQEHICLLVDQFEELFAYASRHDKAEAALYAQFLMGVLQQEAEGLYCIVTMRSEFLGACARYTGFAEAVNKSQYLLPRMTHGDLMRAIQEPALLYDGQVSDALASKLIADARGDQDELPLIQHGLMLLTREHCAAVEQASSQGAEQPWRLDVSDRRGAGLQALLSDHADAVVECTMADAADPALVARVLEEVFRALTDIDADGNAVRRPQTLEALAAVCQISADQLCAILAPFRADGVSFLRPHDDTPIAPTDLVDISHEALIRCWRRISDAREGWLQQEFEDGLVWRSLRVQAAAFANDPRSVLSPATTAERTGWYVARNAAWAERYGGEWHEVGALIDASAEAAEQSQRVAEQLLLATTRAEQNRAQARRRLVGLGVALVLLAVVIVAAWHAFQLRDKAEQAREEAFASALAAREARADALAQLEALQVANRQRDDLKRQAAAVVASRSSLASLIDEFEETNDQNTVAILADSIGAGNVALSVEDGNRLVQSYEQKLARLVRDDGTVWADLELSLGSFIALVPVLPRQVLVARAGAVVGELAPLLAPMAVSISEPSLIALGSALAARLDAPQSAQTFYSFAPLLDGHEQPALAPLLRALAQDAEFPPPRVYVHIAQEAQRSAAETMAQTLRARTLNGVSISVPGIQLRKYGGASELRCFEAPECAIDGGPLVSKLRSIVQAPEIVLQPISNWPTDEIRPRHYELWFGPGDLQASAALTVGVLVELGVSPEQAQAFVGPLNETMARYEINTPRRQSHFLAQVLHESGSLRVTEENLNYSADALAKVFRQYFPTLAMAQKYARRPQAIANIVYADRLGNGDEASGDGWHYRGRGLMFVTGRANYEAFARDVDPRILDNPDLVATEFAAEAAGWYWDRSRLNSYADEGDVRRVTRRVNGSDSGLAHRTELFLKATKLLGTQ